MQSPVSKYMLETNMKGENVQIWFDMARHHLSTMIGAYRKQHILFFIVGKINCKKYWLLCLDSTFGAAS